MVEGAMPAGVNVRELVCNTDSRGELHELIRFNWPDAFEVAQWNVFHSMAHVLRGMAVHLKTTCYYVNVSGRALLGLADLRQTSTTFGQGCVVRLDDDRLLAVTVPTGVAHGLYCASDCISLAGLSQRYDPEDKLGCRWDDSLLAIPWPVIQPTLLSKEASWPSAASLLSRIANREPRPRHA
jgi:dTDP-4-dehydrorhamnose 3,5-epimerase